MSSRNLSEVYVLMRNNAVQNRQIYSENRNADGERLLKRTLYEAEEGLELRDDYGPPSWIDKLEEAQYIISKTKPKLDELSALHVRHLLRPTLEDRCEEEGMIDNLSQDISKLISSTHRHIQCIRSCLERGKKLEQRLTKNVITYLLLALQDLTVKFRNSQNSYLRKLNSREERSNVFFETPTFMAVDLNAESAPNYDAPVDTFDNFLKPKSSTATFLLDQDESIDETFQRPLAPRMTQTQLLLFEEENTRLAESREQEVSKIVRSIFDLNDVFKELGQLVHAQGTVLDQIDYNIENTQTKVYEGFRQLQKAEMYQRKNRKMYCIFMLAGVTLFMLVLLIFVKLN